MMAHAGDRVPPPCPRCGHPATVLTGHTRGWQRWRRAGRGRTFGSTTGTAMYRLKMLPAEMAHAPLQVLRRSSLRAAEDLTGHKYETIGHWLRQAATYAEALTEAHVTEVQLAAVEVDEFWSFVHHTGWQPRRPAPSQTRAGCGRAA